MSIFDVFKKKPELERKKPEIKKTAVKKAIKPEQKKSVRAKEEKQTPAKETKEKQEVKVEEKKEVQEKKIVKPRSISKFDISWKVLEKPHITEKATDLTSKNQYVFRVFKNVNKAQVKKAVENVYGIDVEQVRIINVLPKKRKVGKTEGWTKGYKKAIVKIKEGQEIEVLPR